MQIPVAPSDYQIRNSSTGDLAICVLVGSPGFPYILSFEKHCSNPFIISAMCVCDDKPKVICMSVLEEIKTVTQ